MDTDTALVYLTLSGQLSAAVEDGDVFKIVALMSLFNGARAKSATGDLAKERKITSARRRIATRSFFRRLAIEGFSKMVSLRFGFCPS